MLYKDKRNIPILALQKKDNVLIPFWELEFIKSDLYGDGYRIKETKEESFANLKEVFWDLKNQKIIIGIIKDYYPSNLEYSVGEDVLFEVKSREYGISKIKEIRYDTYETEIIKIKKSDNSTINWYFTKEEKALLNPNDIYEIRKWQPIYILENGKEIKHDHQLLKLKLDKQMVIQLKTPTNEEIINS